MSCFSPKIYLQGLWKRLQFALDQNLGHFKANLLGNKTAKTDAFHRRLNKDKAQVAKTPIPQVLACVSLCWPPMTICGKNVDTLRTCKWSNRDFFAAIQSTRNTYILCSPVFLYITRGVLRCLLGFFALWGQKPCRGNKTGALGNTPQEEYLPRFTV